MIYGVRTLFVAACRNVTVAAGGACGSGGRPPRVCSARVTGSDELWQTKKNLVLCSRIAESSFHFDPV